MKNNPFTFFSIISYLLISAICIFLAVFCKGYSIENIHENIPVTISLSLFGVFLPMVFAAIIYCKTKLSENTPEIFTELSIDRKVYQTFFILGVLLLLSLLSPLMEFYGGLYGFFQLILIAVSFITSSYFVVCLFSAKYSNVLPLFCNSLKKKIPNLIEGYKCSKDRSSEESIKQSLEHFFSMLLKHIDIESRLNLIITLNEMESYIRYFYSTLEKEITNFKDRTALLENGDHNSLIQIKNLEDFHKLISDYLLTEIQKFIFNISNNKQEKYLDYLPFFLEKVMTATFEPRNKYIFNKGYHCSSWSSLINQTVYKTALLQNTTYPNYAIKLYRKLSEYYFTYNPSQAVYGLTYKLYGLLYAIDDLKSKTKRNKAWFNVLESIVITEILYLFPQCAKKGCDSLVTRKWFDCMSDSIMCIDEDDPDMLLDGNPVSVLTSTTSNDSIPFAYLAAIRYIFEKDYSEKAKMSSLYSLDSIYSVYSLLVKKEKTCMGEVAQAVFGQFYLDLEVYDNLSISAYNWGRSASEGYRVIFEAYKETLKENKKQTNLWDLNYLIAIPAIALIKLNDNKSEFTDNVILYLALMLKDSYSEVNSDRTKNDIRSHILLLSAWLNKTNRLPEVKDQLEVILNQNPYYNSRTFIPDNYGLPDFNRSGLWCFHPCMGYSNSSREKVYEELMDQDYLVEYAKKFVTGHNGGANND
jgi:hypothetical protein